MEGKTEGKIDFQNMPAYVINLDRRTDRWETFSKQELIGYFHGIERISATDGKYLDVENDTRISLHTRDNIRNNMRRSHYEINTPGACGASFSHIACWKKFLETEEEYCLIIEDDCMLRKDDFAKAVVYSKNVPSEFDIWILGMHNGSLVSVDYAPGSPWSKIGRFTGAHCYILTRKAAQLLLKECFPIETHIEFYMCATVKTNNMLMISHKNLRVPQLVETTYNNDSDTVAEQTCPLCKIPTNPSNIWVLVPISSLLHAGIAMAAVGFVTYGYFKKMRC
jgi:GR25 family glycosyltransferase involved in LPS biosynthesis